MVDTPVNLWRARPPHSAPVTSEGDSVGVLYPDFEARDLPGGGQRRPDVTEIDGDVQTGGGTSLWNIEGALDVAGRDPWVYFPIPVGTPIPPSLNLHKSKKNRRTPSGRKGRHYQIEVDAPMTRQAYKDALDTYARAAFAKRYTDARAPAAKPEKVE